MSRFFFHVRSADVEGWVKIGSLSGRNDNMNYHLRGPRLVYCAPGDTDAYSDVD